MIVVSPEKAYDGIASFWCGAGSMGVTILSEGELQVRIDSRADGSRGSSTRPASPDGLEDATRLLAATDERLCEASTTARA